MRMQKSNGSPSLAPPFSLLLSSANIQLRPSVSEFTFRFFRSKQWHAAKKKLAFIVILTVDCWSKKWTRKRCKHKLDWELAFGSPGLSRVCRTGALILDDRVPRLLLRAPSRRQNYEAAHLSSMHHVLSYLAKTMRPRLPAAAAAPSRLQSIFFCHRRRPMSRAGEGGTQRHTKVRKARRLLHHF